ncbi:MAG: DUF655 domain-containing protein [Sulfurovum sp.]|nr:DUF655 domain-containing protein [Sulfurovum sp.]MCB4744212.1 DUF655 domain-containing protein [Sulfurovum sp.]MCB4745572.1 DUF655 domain-containing protein [Sulfurovum sp.]MCB4749213.1 DUF655 domain-containing protein [Sulfurovum sp.]MCB4750010.1 DUF655 domain-containing protein [Sulfurovum sp.]
MLKKIILILMVLVSTGFGMSLEKLNSASKEELMQFNGIGEKRADTIIEERHKGEFKSYEDLAKRVKGIGKRVIANIKGDIKNSQGVKKNKEK